MFLCYLQDYFLTNVMNSLESIQFTYIFICIVLFYGDYTIIIIVIICLTFLLAT